MRRPDKVILNNERLTLLLEGEKETSIQWDEVYAISFHKVDAVFALVSYLVFDHENGDYLEIHDKTEGFEELVTNLSKYIPISDANWQTKFRSALPDEGSITIYQQP